MQRGWYVQLRKWTGRLTCQNLRGCREIAGRKEKMRSAETLPVPHRCGKQRGLQIANSDSTALRESLPKSQCRILRFVPSARVSKSASTALPRWNWLLPVRKLPYVGFPKVFPYESSSLWSRYVSVWYETLCALQ